MSAPATRERGGALRIIERGRFAYPEHAVCVGGCEQIGTNGKPIGKKFAKYVALMAGVPVTGLCERCREAWLCDWEAALVTPLSLKRVQRQAKRRERVAA